jgi:hypothetical protein
VIAFNSTYPPAEKVLSAGEKLQDIRIYGAMIADGTGFGKTNLAMLGVVVAPRSFVLMP